MVGSSPSGSPSGLIASRTRRSKLSAALFVNVRPRISFALAWPFTISHTMRAAITAVLPEPAPAIRTLGSSGALIADHCCFVGDRPPSAS